MEIRIALQLNLMFLMLCLVVSCGGSGGKSVSGIGSAGSAQDLAPESPRWNILMIAIDDLDYWPGHLQTRPDILTPNIDRIARAGMSFRYAYAAAPACNPSRWAILTGVRPTTSGVYFNEDTYLRALSFVRDKGEGVNLSWSAG
ncbi:MAG: sulfatase-like hydrolase/transferase [Halioglobus sp.]|nr:sulfatase-like hydrolase/transferase [Halioglobus sp.]